MNILLQSKNLKDYEGNVIFLYGDEVADKALPLRKDEILYLKNQRAADKHSMVAFDRLPYKIYVQNFDSEADAPVSQEKLRKAAAELQLLLSKAKQSEVYLTGEGVLPEEVMAMVEGLELSNYRFDKYKSKKDFRVETLVVDDRLLKESDIETNRVLWKWVCSCRDWVNEPVMALNADQLASQIKDHAVALNVECAVFGKGQIASMKMGGLSAVNKGSVDEPRFVVLNYHPKDAVNKAPLALVGKGITYDTGGLNIKPDDYMQEMKTDMAGAATMASVVLAAAENHLPVWTMAFLPMTDNRPGFNAYAADDIITMYDGTTVEVVNTDAEGRIILADAIAYANQYNPEVIIDCATLTGAAVRAIGTIGIAAMHQKADNAMRLLKIVSHQVYERVAELPFWEEYDELIKSEVADIKNCSDAAGAITAGKFLAHFAKSPYIHLDIAGVAYYAKREHFYGTGASGFGVRLLYAFMQTYDMIEK